MGLYLVEHHHSAESCPAQNVEMATALAGHVTPDNAAKFGLSVVSDCVVEGEHTLFLLVDSDSQDKVEAFAAPFKQAGPTTIKPAITCDIVAGRAKEGAAVRD